MKYLIIIAALLSITLQSFSQTGFKIGDKVDAWNVAWYKATVIEVGSGSNVGYYKVHYDDFSSASDQYLKASNIRAKKNAAAETLKNSTANGPRLSKYLIMSYGAGNNPLHLGFFHLKEGGNYSFFDMGENKLGDGKYAYDAPLKQVSWLSGPLKAFGTTAGFEVSREGKTHNIRLKGGTIGTNSTDSK